MLPEVSIKQIEHCCVKGSTLLTTQKHQAKASAAMMRALQKFLLFHALTCLGRNGKLLSLTASLRVMLTHFNISFSSHVFSTWDWNHTRANCSTEPDAVYGLSADQIRTPLWRLPHQWQLCPHCCALWSSVSWVSESPELFYFFFKCSYSYESHKLKRNVKSVALLCCWQNILRKSSDDLLNLTFSSGLESVVLGTHDLRSGGTVRRIVQRCRYPYYQHHTTGGDIMLLKVSIHSLRPFVPDDVLCVTVKLGAFEICMFIFSLRVNVKRGKKKLCWIQVSLKF